MALCSSLETTPVCFSWVYDIIAEPVGLIKIIRDSNHADTGQLRPHSHNATVKLNAVGLRSIDVCNKELLRSVQVAI